jgi:hypothetical protein
MNSADRRSAKACLAVFGAFVLLVLAAWAWKAGWR